MITANKIDVHAHYFPPAFNEMLSRHGIERIDGATKPAWSEESQLEFMDGVGIETAVLTPSSPPIFQGEAAEAAEVARACNEYGADLVARYPKRFAVTGALPVPDVEATIAELRHCRDELDIDSFAMLTQSGGIYLGSDELDPIMSELNDRPATVILHPTHPGVVPDARIDRMPDALMEYLVDTTRAIASMIVAGTLRKYPNVRFVVPHGGAFG